MYNECIIVNNNNNKQRSFFITIFNIKKKLFIPIENI